MFTKFDKAGAAAIGAAITALVTAFTTLDPATVTQIGVVITTFLTWLVPQKEA